MRKLFLTFLMLAWAGMAMAGTVTLAALGDSLVAGYGLPQGDGFVPRMERWLTDRGHDVRILNAGVSGDTTAGGAARVDWTLTPEVAGLIVVLGGNDMLRGNDPADVRANLDKILNVATARGVSVLLIGMQAPGNYGLDYKRAFDAAYPELAQKYGVLLHDNFFAAFAGTDLTPENLRQYMQADGIHPNADGVDRIVDDIGPDIERLLLQIGAR